MAISEGEPTWHSSAVEQEGLKDPADAAGAEDGAEVQWYKDPVVSEGCIASL